MPLWEVLDAAVMVIRRNDLKHGTNAACGLCLQRVPGASAHSHGQEPLIRGAQCSVQSWDDLIVIFGWPDRSRITVLFNSNFQHLIGLSLSVLT